MKNTVTAAVVFALAAALAACGEQRQTGRAPTPEGGHEYGHEAPGAVPAPEGGAKPEEGYEPEEGAKPGEGAAAVNRTEFQNSIQLRLDDCSRKIDELRSRANAATGEERDRLMKQVEDFEAKRRSISDDIAALREASDADWQTRRDALTKAKDDFEAAVNETVGEK